MLKFVSTLIFVSVLFNFSISESMSFFDTKGKTSATATPIPTPNSPAKIEKLNLSKNEVFLPCPPNARTPKFCLDDFIIDVHAHAVDADNDVVVYKYTVSGGKIIGQGANVKWNLSGVRLGTYKLTAEVDDGYGFCGESKNLTVEVRECDGCPFICECPTISVSGPKTIVKPGETMTFTANISGSETNITYKWKVSNGIIIEGQGTSVIKVFSQDPDEGVAATIEIGGLDECCPNTASETTPIAEED